MANINLLPPDLGPKASVLRLSASLKKLTTLALVIFCVFGTATGVYIFWLNTRIKQVQASNEVLKTTLKSLAETEQGLFLVKDRLAKIKALTGQSDKQDPLVGFEQILGAVSPDVSLTEVKAASGELSLSGSCTSGEALGRFWQGILTNPEYKTVELENFSFNPKSGYLFELRIASR